MILKMGKNYIEISWASLWKIFIMIVFATFLYYTRETVALVFVAIVVSSAIYNPVKYFEERGIPRSISVLTIFFIGGAVMALVLYALIPVAIIQLQFFLVHIGSLQLPFFESVGISGIVKHLENGLSGLLAVIAQGSSGITGFVSGVLGNLFFISTAVVLSFYLSISKDGIERFLKAILPKNVETTAIEVYKKTRRKLGRWLGGQLVLSFSVGLLTFIGLSILGVKYAILLSLLAAILEIVPYIGPIMVGTIAFLVTVPQSLTMALFVVLVFFIIQELENNILVPIIMSKAVDVDPITVVIALLAGAQIAGIVGMLLAVPVTIVVEEMINNWSDRKKQKNLLQNS